MYKIEPIYMENPSNSNPSENDNQLTLKAVLSDCRSTKDVMPFYQWLVDNSELLSPGQIRTLLEEATCILVATKETSTAIREIINGYVGAEGPHTISFRNATFKRLPDPAFYQVCLSDGLTVEAVQAATFIDQYNPCDISTFITELSRLGFLRIKRGVYYHPKMRMLLGDFLTNRGKKFKLAV